MSAARMQTCFGAWTAALTAVFHALPVTPDEFVFATKGLK